MLCFASSSLFINDRRFSGALIDLEEPLLCVEDLLPIVLPPVCLLETFAVPFGTPVFALLSLGIVGGLAIFGAVLVMCSAGMELET